MNVIKEILSSNMRVVCIKKYVYVYKEPLLLYADYFVCERESEDDQDMQFAAMRISLLGRRVQNAIKSRLATLMPVIIMYVLMVQLWQII